jgi:hypothetical protein
MCLHHRDGSWHFVVSFANLLVKNVRTCHTSAVKQPSADDALRRGSSSLVEWVMTRDELDRKVNAEVHVIIDKHRGQEAAVSRETMRRTQAFAMRGYLFKNAPTGLRLRWQKRFFVLTGSELQYFEAEDAVGRPAGSIALKDIEHVKEGKDAIKDWVFEIHLKESCGREPYRLSAIAPNDRWQWLRAISQALSASPNSNFASGASTAGGTSASTRSTLHRCHWRSLCLSVAATANQRRSRRRLTLCRRSTRGWGCRTVWGKLISSWMTSLTPTQCSVNAVWGTLSLARTGHSRTKVLCTTRFAALMSSLYLFTFCSFVSSVAAE